MDRVVSVTAFKPVIDGGRRNADVVESEPNRGR